MPLHTRMGPRDPDEAHRASTPLELFFDLAFVIAVGEAADSLHHGLIVRDFHDTLLAFPMVFFAIWWAWMNFAWFASAYDNDDGVYRFAVLVEVGGVLCLAVGVPRVFEHQDFGIVLLGYVIMRIALVAQWLRAAASHPDGRASALRYAFGVTVVQIGWIAWWLAIPDSVSLAAFGVLVLAELLVPFWAESAARTPWHPRHIAERYGLFTIIVLGEVMLGATIGVQTALDFGTSFGDLAPVVFGGLLLVFSMWWFYFDMPADQTVERARRAFAIKLSGAFAWGYGHYVVFGSASAAGAGLAIAVDQAAGHSGLTDVQAGFALTVPVALYLLSVWIIHYRQKQSTALHRYAVPVVATLILASSFTAEPVLVSGVALAVLVALGSALSRPAGSSAVGDGLDGPTVAVGVGEEDE
jgi:low temperature requirement protein LtrA